MVFILQRTSVNPTRIAATLNPSSSVLKAGTHRLLLEAQQIIEAATAAAAEIIAEAQHAYEREKTRGYEEGLEAAQLDHAERMMENVGRAIDYFSRVEEDAMDLVMTAVRKIVGDYDDKEKVAIVVRGALTAVRNQKQITLRLHPEEVVSVKARLSEILAGFPAIGFVDVVGDARLGRAACILETDIGMVETSLEGQLNSIRRAFTQVLGEASGSGLDDHSVATHSALLGGRV